MLMKDWFVQNFRYHILLLTRVQENCRSDCADDCDGDVVGLDSNTQRVCLQPENAVFK
jgi:hypothetical protein